MILDRVISGGQTGADRAGLAAAKTAGIATGGWMPKGFRAQDGSRPEFAELYGVQEHASDRYPPRTALNVKESDATIRFATDWNSPGEVLTLQMCERYGKPQLEVTPGGSLSPAEAAAWLIANEVRVLNVAGNAERTFTRYRGVRGRVHDGSVSTASRVVTPLTRHRNCSNFHHARPARKHHRDARLPSWICYFYC